MKRIRLENTILTRKVFYLDFYRFTATYFSVGALSINYFKATLEHVAENVKLKSSGKGFLFTHFVHFNNT